jgi:hypothetical protein
VNVIRVVNVIVIVDVNVDVNVIVIVDVIVIVIVNGNGIVNVDGSPCHNSTVALTRQVDRSRHGFRSA